MWIEKIKLRTTDPASRTDVGNIPDGAIGELTTLFEQTKSDPTKLAALDFDLTDVVKKLPAELKRTARPDDPEWLCSVLDEAESLLLDRLLGSGVEE